MNRVLASLILLLVLPGFALAQKGAVAFQVDRIHVGDGTVHEPGMLLVQDGKIVAIGSSLELPRGTPVVKKPGCEMTAGLIDAAAIGLVSARATEQISEVIPQMRAADAIDLGDQRFARLAREGVTTVFATATTDSVLGCQGAVLKTGDTARLMDSDGACKLTVTHDPSSRNGGPRRGQAPTVFTRRPTSQMGVVYVAREAFMNAADIVARGDKLTEGSAEAMIASVLAGKQALRVRADEQYEIAAALRMAEEFGFTFILEGAPEAWRMAKQLKAAAIPVVLGPVRIAEDAGGGRFRGSEPKSRAATATVLDEAGVTFALTAGDQSGEYGLARQGSHVRRHGLALGKTLSALTTIPAKLLGMDKKIGRLAVGYDADFIIWSGEPFAATSLIESVVIDGQKVRGKSY